MRLWFYHLYISVTCNYTISGPKQLILDQTIPNGYQTVPFGVYIHNLMFHFNFGVSVLKIVWVRLWFYQRIGYL